MKCNYKKNLKQKNKGDKSMQEIKCCICGKRMPVIAGNNPYPVREWSCIGSDKNRCCHTCNSMFVVPVRIAIGKKTKDEQLQVHNQLKTYSYEELVEFKEKYARLS